MTNVGAYTDSQLLERIESIGGVIPNRGKYMAVGVQSIEDGSNIFDDKFYVYDGPDFKMVSSGTTNAGKTALQFFDDYGLEGAAVWQTDQWCPNVFAPGMHKGKMKALRQVNPINYFRDTNKDLKAEEIGPIHNGIIYANMHGVSYDPNSLITKEQINGWSFGCQVWNNMKAYKKFIKMTWARNKHVDYALLKEF